MKVKCGHLSPMGWRDREGVHEWDDKSARDKEKHNITKQKTTWLKEQWLTKSLSLARWESQSERDGSQSKNNAIIRVKVNYRGKGNPPQNGTMQKAQGSIDGCFSLRLSSSISK